MENIDLNIDNYGLIELLNLFRLDYEFGKKELKQAKKIVWEVHPDKSKLPKEYFIFFLSAFKIIYSIYEFRNQSNRSRSTTYEIEKDEEKEILLKEISKSNNFNKIFNELFEKHYIKEEEVEEGYGDWLKTDENESIELSNTKDMHNEFEKQKHKIRSLVIKNNVEDIYNYNYKNLTGDKPESYSSEIFSTLNYEDIRKAHTETIVPVSEEDYKNKKKFNNTNDLQNYRDIQDIKPLSESQSLEYLNNKTKLEDEKSVKRAYRLAKQDENNKKINDAWMRGFKLLKD